MGKSIVIVTLTAALFAAGIAEARPACRATEADPFSPCRISAVERSAAAVLLAQTSEPTQQPPSEQQPTQQPPPRAPRQAPDRPASPFPQIPGAPILPTREQRKAFCKASKQYAAQRRAQAGRSLSADQRRYLDEWVKEQCRGSEPPKAKARPKPAPTPKPPENG